MDFSTAAIINERIVKRGEDAVSSRVSGEPIYSIKRNIGLNDRFMIIRELLNGENEAYNDIVNQLDSCNNFNESFKLLETKFPDKLEHEGVKILINLSRRKFISSGNV